MESNAQDRPGYYIWQVPEKLFTVQIHLDLVDRMSAEVLRGFGLVPKRGAEVGGVLLGSIEMEFAALSPSGPPEKIAPREGEEQAPDGSSPTHGKLIWTTVRIDNFEPVACGYSRGPSYLLTGAEQANFTDVIARLDQDPYSAMYPVGYFRSHTRDGSALGDEDLELLDRHFPDAPQIALLIRPFATKVSTAGIFFRENGQFPAETPLEFPFRRREMSGEAPPPRRSFEDRQRLQEQRLKESRNRGPQDPFGPDSMQEPAGEPRRGMRSTPRMDAARAEAERMQAEVGGMVDLYPPMADISLPPLTPIRTNRWMWIPLSLVFLLLGLALGFQGAVTMLPQLRGTDAKNIALGLTVSRTGDSLTVRWNRDSLPVKAAERGVLEIEEDGTKKPVELDTGHLHDGSVTYQSPATEVHFKLIVYLAPRLAVSEMVDWNQ
ncbi:MAG: hypothetical protein ABI824_20085 [Acidobacteriota bacterium]